MFQKFTRWHWDRGTQKTYCRLLSSLPVTIKLVGSNFTLINQYVFQEVLGPSIDVDVTLLCSTTTNIVACVQEPSCMKTPQLDSVACHSLVCGLHLKPLNQLYSENILMRMWCYLSTTVKLGWQGASTDSGEYTDNEELLLDLTMSNLVEEQQHRLLDWLLVQSCTTIPFLISQII